MISCRLTVVVDNKAENDFVAEHGFSLYVETTEGNYLLDAGQKEALLPNLNNLGIAPADISTLVLSHGHYDHTGGVADLIEQNRDIEIYLHAGVFQPRYSLDGEEPTIVKMPLAAMEAVMHHAESRTHWLTKPMIVSGSVGITGPIPRRTDYEDTGGSFFLDPDGHEIDTIQDDIAMYIKEKDGLIVCVGCCHSGLVNTLTRITEVTGENRIALVIGGLHLHNASSQRLEKTVEELNRFKIGRIVACHCSGDDAVKYLRENLNAEVSFGHAGLIIDL